MPDVQLVHADALDALRDLPDNSIDAIVTDPPYGLSNHKPNVIADVLARWVAGESDATPKTGRGFMTAAWDRFVPPPALWRECLRVLKPGGHMTVFAGARTQDLMGLAIRLAGFEIRDGLGWIYGSGMPHGQDCSKTVDAELLTGTSHSRGIRHTNEHRPGEATYANALPVNGKLSATTAPPRPSRAEPATPEGAAWRGWNTHLKPAFEPIILARKPLAATSIARNLLEHGTGALHVDACRVPHANAADLAESVSKNQHATFGTAPGRNQVYGDYSMVASKNYTADTGRFPPTILLSHTPDCTPTGTSEVRTTTTHHPATRPAGGIGSDGNRGQTGLTERRPDTETVTPWDCVPGCQIAELDHQSGATKSSGGNGAASEQTIPGSNSGGVGDIGGASRFFPTLPVDDLTTRFRYCAKAPTSERPTYVTDDGTTIRHHTVKPLAIMRWLVRLVTPTGGTVLDPFAGSGTTAEAALLEGFDSINIEREPDYLPLIQQRINRHVCQ